MLEGIPVGGGHEDPGGDPGGPGRDGERSAAAYGLGIRSDRLLRGVSVRGHGGQVPGSLSRAAATRDGRHVLTLDRNGDWGEQRPEDAVLEAEFRGRGRTAS
ncbi:hypothetical protein ABZ714_20545 [Streptomyces sp. NPDC006798]|uniref:hypothetical protein n=1 Tax=Streptomyces sp. NPDC006798 TaxID=3155462 RepID=UPI0033E9819C